jgi:hypothetical protein
MAKFLKGKPKTGGRKANTPNKITSELREKISSFLSNNWDTIAKDFDNAPPKDRLLFYEKLLQYVLPKLENIGLHEIGFENLTDEQLDRLIAKLKNEHEPEPES